MDFTTYVPYEDSDPGYYTDNADINIGNAQQMTPLAFRAIDAMPELPRSPFTICDYGTADGGVSLGLIRAIIELIRRKNDQIQFHIIYEDQPVNDFKNLFLRMHGFLSGPRSYLMDYTGVFISAVGTGFYQQCVPDNSIQFGISTLAMHWLSSVPCPLTGTVLHKLATIEEEKKIWKEQAAKDWETILLQRAKELSPGSNMVISCTASGKDGHNREDSPIFKNFDKIFYKLIQEGDITLEEFQNSNICVYYRTREELKEPWTKPNSCVSKAGLDLESLDITIVNCPLTEQWKRMENKDREVAASMHAVKMTNNVRKWCNSSISSGLSESRPLEQRKAIVEKFFRIYQAEIETSPCDFCYSFPVAYIQISKKI